MFMVCFGVSVSPSQACNMTGEAQAPTAEQIPHHHGGQAQQRTLAAFSNTAACFSMFGGLSPSNWPWRTWPHLRSNAAKEPRGTGMPNTAKRECTPPWSFPEALLLTPPTLIATSRYSDQGTKRGRSDVSNLDCL